jgi:phosphatidylserine/phosphatidylglycerophosphate/cardiolipin synthase-like enzyme
LRTGTASRLTQGNALRWLADNEDGWGRVADVVKNGSTIDVMQLSIDVDPYHADAADGSSHITDENPVVVLRFDPAQPPASAGQCALTTADQRIERALLEAYRRGADVRIQLPKPTIDKHGLAVVGTAILGIASLILLGGWIALVAELVLGVLAAAALVLVVYFRKELRASFRPPALVQWFADAGTLPGRDPVRVKQLHMRSNLFTHAKIVIDRGREAVLLGSPFGQDYFDVRQHAIDDPRRGRSASKGPIHDVSVGVRGPAVGHLQEVFNVHWNLADPGDKLPVAPELPPPLASADPGEFRTAVQVVRTLDPMFTEGATPPSEEGEKGVLEAYLRAIHFAQRFIYIENQYFNNDTLTQALIDALAANPKLAVILLVNATPDMPLYLGWQQAAIKRIADSVGHDAAAKNRFGAFSAWTHAASDAAHAKPRLVDNYLHTKSALIDNRWATVGSANLDGASLDFIQYARSALDGELRNSETNLVVFEDPAARPSSVDALRRQLWAEHLGIADPNSALLDDAPDKNWLEVWNRAAAQKLFGLKNNLDTVLGLEGPGADSQTHILAWPAAAFGEGLHFWNRHHSHRAAPSYLAHLFSDDEKPSEALLSQFEVLGEKGPPSFRFKYRKP